MLVKILQEAILNISLMNKWKEMRDKDDSPETEEIELESSEENNIIKNIPYKGGQLVLEYETMFGTPKYMIYFDTEEGDNTNKIVAELDSEFLMNRCHKLF